MGSQNRVGAHCNPYQLFESMSMKKIRDASIGDIEIIRAMANHTWWPAYGGDLSPEQLAYMLETLYSESVLRELISTDSQKFILLEEEGTCHAFASFSARENEPVVCKLNKLYVLPQSQRKGYGAALVGHVVERLALEGVHILDLNVARFNNARNFYEKLGFRVIGEEDISLGPFLLKDYIMRLNF